MFQTNIKDSVYSVFKRKLNPDDYFKPFFKFTDNNANDSEFIFQVGNETLN